MGSISPLPLLVDKEAEEGRAVLKHGGTLSSWEEEGKKQERGRA